MDLTLSRKLSILSYLGAHGPVQLRDLAQHYGIESKAMQQELQDLFMVELAVSGGYECPIDLDFAEDYSPEGYVDLSKQTAKEFAEIHLGFDEFLAVLAWIDFLLPIADETQYAALLQLRAQLVQGANARGYASAIWPRPSLKIDRKIVNQLHLALAKQVNIRFDYWKADDETATTQVQEVVGTPLELVALNQPLLHLQTTRGMRSYRLDRIANVELLQERHTRRQLDLARAQLRNNEKTEIDFTGGTALLSCDLQARWIVESYPGIRVLETSSESINQIPQDMRNNLPEGQIHASVPEGNAKLQHPQTALLAEQTGQTERTDAMAPLQLAVDYNSISSLFAILLRLGDAVWEIQPPELADRIAERAQLLLAANQREI